MKKPKTVSDKTTPKPQPKKTTAAETKPVAAKKSAVKKAPPKKNVATPSIAASVTPEPPISERIGLTAGEIWCYLDKNGPTSVATLIKELSEQEKIIQRSIGWLAKEDKLSIETVGRIETIALKV